MTTHVVFWVIIPAWIGLFLYSALVLSVYPYARPLFPLWLLFVAIIVPPFFPFLLTYLAFALCFLAPRRVVVVEDVVVARPTVVGRARR